MLPLVPPAVTVLLELLDRLPSDLLAHVLHGVDGLKALLSMPPEASNPEVRRVGVTG